MLLKSMKLKNFRQFKGEQTITFSTDTEKNVTIIMGVNGSGKTSLAQAFTWCFYGSTDFNDKNVLNKLVAKNMTPNDKEKVFVEVFIQHQGRDYIIKSEQNYSKKINGDVSENGQRSFSIAYKADDGTQKFIDGLKTNEKMKEIIPKELIKYFFFDGEHIEVMGKQISRGKGDEFADAVKSILGLKSYTSALKHLKVVKNNFNKQYDVKGNESLEKYNNKIESLTIEIEKIETRITEIEGEKERLTEKTEKLNWEIIQNKSSEDLAKRRLSLERQKNSLIINQKRSITELFRLFNKNAPAYFATKMMFNALTQLKEANIIDKSIKDVTANTINQIIENGKCICGAEVCTGNEAYNTLNSLRDFIPPKHIGTIINEFKNLCNIKARSINNLYNIFTEKYGETLIFDTDIQEIEQEIQDITTKLEDLKDVGKLQSDLNKYNSEISKIERELVSISGDKRVKEIEKGRLETERLQLTLKDNNNRKINKYKAYADYMINYIYEEYTQKEKLIRDELGTAVNQLFKEIYTGGFSLQLSEKYDVQIIADDLGGYSEKIETSTAQSISIIFAFISGVIKIARESEHGENGLIQTEAYPLVMDAPLSAFDTERIKTVCEVLPKVAEQVIIFIKDTDGNLAQEHLNAKIGHKATFIKHSEFETYIQ